MNKRPADTALQTANLESSSRDFARNRNSPARLLKGGAILVVVTGVLVGFYALPAERSAQQVTQALENLGVFAPLGFATIYLVATILMLPASALSLAAGALFGLWLGTLTVLLGAICGMAVTFLLGRYVVRGAVERRLEGYPRARAIDRAIGAGGWRIVALLRLSPAVPFNLQNYLYGITAIGFWPCMGASAVAIIPGTFLYVYLGHASRAGLAAAGTGEATRGAGQWLLLVAGLIATIAVTIYVTRLARKALREVTGEGPATKQTGPGSERGA